MRVTLRRARPLLLAGATAACGAGAGHGAGTTPPPTAAASPTPTAPATAGAPTASADPSATPAAAHTPTPTATPARCPACSGRERIGALGDDALAELSGVAASRAHPGVLWTHNDSGADAVLYAIDTSGARLRRVELAGTSAQDWEDIDLGPCPAPAAGDCLYIGDVGDNGGVRDDLAVLVVAEPEPRAPDASVEPLARLPFRWPGGPRDCEALSVASDGTLRLLEKTLSPPALLARFPAPLTPGVEVELVEEARFDHPQLAVAVTAMDYPDDDRWLLVRGYFQAFFLELSGDGPPCPAGRLEEPQGEAITWLPGGGFLTLSEGRETAVHRYACPPPGAPARPD